MSGSTVIVEPDSVGAWLGLVGVVAGVAISTGANWLQGRQRGRDERQRELDAATGEVVALASAAILLVEHLKSALGDSSAGMEKLGAYADWADKIATALERLQVADQVIQRYGKAEVAAASQKVVLQVTEVARYRRTAQLADNAIANYTNTLQRKVTT